MKKESRIFGEYSIELLTSALSGTEVKAPPEGFDWIEFYKFTKKHNVANLLYYILEDMESVPKNIRMMLKDSQMKAVAREAAQELEKDEILNAFENAGIKHMILKGIEMKSLYPRPDMRSMSDIDIVIDEKKIAAAKEIMLDMGFSLYEECELHDIYRKPPFVNVEIHRHFMDEKFEELNDYFGSEFNNYELADGKKYQYKLTKEDFFIFLVAHAAKHYYMTGIGIRFIMDIWIYKSKYSREMDNKKIESAFRKIGILEFYIKAVTLSEIWFGKREYIKSYEAMEDYIFSNGVFGISENEISNRFIMEEKPQGNLFIKKIKYIVSTVFPGYRYMKIYYPFLKKTPFLLPFMWIVRFIRTFLYHRKNIRYRLVGVIKLKNTELNK